MVCRVHAAHAGAGREVSSRGERAWHLRACRAIAQPTLASAILRLDLRPARRGLADAAGRAGHPPTVRHDTGAGARAQGSGSARGVWAALARVQAKSRVDRVRPPATRHGCPPSRRVAARSARPTCGSRRDRREVGVWRTGELRATCRRLPAVGCAGAARVPRQPALRRARPVRRPASSRNAPWRRSGRAVGAGSRRRTARR